MQSQHNQSASPVTLDPVVRDPLATASFFELVLSWKPKTAVFDCDGTLWHGDTGTDFMLWTMETGLVSRETASWINARHVLYGRGQLSEAAICGEMAQMYAGLPEMELRRAAAAFFRDKFEQNFFPEMLALAQRLTAAGTQIWLVSSTNSWVVEEGAARIGVPPDRVLASRVRVANGMVTSELLDVPTGEGKAASLRAAGIAAPDVVFGNSVHDIAMLAMAAHAVAIHPSVELLRRAERDGWTVHLPAQAGLRP